MDETKQAQMSHELGFAYKSLLRVSKVYFMLAYGLLSSIPRDLYVPVVQFWCS